MANCRLTTRLVRKVPSSRAMAMPPSSSSGQAREPAWRALCRSQPGVWPTWRRVGRTPKRTRRMIKSVARLLNRIQKRVPERTRSLRASTWSRNGLVPGAKPPFGPTSR